MAFYALASSFIPNPSSSLVQLMDSDAPKKKKISSSLIDSDANSDEHGVTMPIPPSRDDDFFA